MGQCITMSGGDGTDLDVITAGASQVLSPFVTVDKDGNPITGTMIDRRKLDASIGGINASYPNVPLQKGSNPQIGQSTVDKKNYFAICPPAGFYDGGGYVGVEQSAVAQAIGLNQYKLIKGSNVLGIPGDPAVVNTADADAWYGTVLEGKVFYANGVRGIGAIPNLTAKTTILHATGNGTKVVLGDTAYVSTNTDGVTRVEIRYNGDSGYITGNTLFGIDQSRMAVAIGLTANILKKGTTRLGITGTAEGYYPTPSDMYYMGTNQANFICSSGCAYVTFYLDHIQIFDDATTKFIKSTALFNLTGHNTLNIEGEFCNGASAGRLLTIERGDGKGWYSFATHTFAGSSCTGRTTVSIPLPANLGQQYVGLSWGSSITGNIYRIWLN